MADLMIMSADLLPEFLEHIREVSVPRGKDGTAT
jgi:hypothetical protein